MSHHTSIPARKKKDNIAKLRCVPNELLVQYFATEFSSNVTATSLMNKIAKSGETYFDVFQSIMTETSSKEIDINDDERDIVSDFLSALTYPKDDEITSRMSSVPVKHDVSIFALFYVSQQRLEMNDGVEARGDTAKQYAFDETLISGFYAIPYDSVIQEAVRTGRFTFQNVFECAFGIDRRPILLFVSTKRMSNPSADLEERKNENIQMLTRQGVYTERLLSRNLKEKLLDKCLRIIDNDKLDNSYLNFCTIELENVNALHENVIGCGVNSYTWSLQAVLDPSTIKW